MHQDKCSLNENRNDPWPTLYNGQPTYTLCKHFPTDIMELYGMLLIHPTYTTVRAAETGKRQTRAMYFTLSSSVILTAKIINTSPVL